MYLPCFYVKMMMMMIPNKPTDVQGGGGGVPHPWGFSEFFLNDKTSAPEVFCSCSFIPRVHFETSLVMVSYYMITKYDVKSSSWSSHFLVKMHFYSNSFRNKSNACFYLISNSSTNGRWRPRWRPWLVTSQTSRGGGGLWLRVRPRVKNSRTPDHRLICLTKSSLTLFTPCPLPDGGKLSLWRKL